MEIQGKYEMSEFMTKEMIEKRQLSYHLQLPYYIIKG